MLKKKLFGDKNQLFGKKLFGDKNKLFGKQIVLIFAIRHYTIGNICG